MTTRAGGKFVELDGLETLVGAHCKCSRGVSAR